MKILKGIYFGLVSKYINNNHLIEKLWFEIESNYSNKKRYYHNLNHLNSLLNELKKAEDKIKDWETILFSLFYHDIIYSATKKNNEEKSAELAKKRMLELSIPNEKIELCKAQILATKFHTKSVNSDTNYFTDADLSILGQSWESYSNYYQNVRKEYSIYPNIIYKRGRKKALKHFLAMNRIFKTDFFFNKYESQAKKNLIMELDLL